jgi:hypothetical protein
MTKAARAQLVKSVLTSTVFNLPKWLVKKINKIRRNLFWKGEEGDGNKGGACLIKWDITCMPKELGGLGFHDLKCFGRALRQSWLWYQWNDDSKPWQGLALPCDEKDKALFRASTLITLGNGKKALFWQDNWLQGKAPSNIAPLLYNLAHFKNRTVEKELQNNKWIQGVRCILTRDELLQFVEL